MILSVTHAENRYCVQDVITRSPDRKGAFRSSDSSRVPSRRVMVNKCLQASSCVSKPITLRDAADQTPCPIERSCRSGPVNDILRTVPTKTEKTERRTSTPHRVYIVLRSKILPRCFAAHDMPGSGLVNTVEDGRDSATPCP
jgi:hypothetical protein